MVLFCCCCLRSASVLKSVGWCASDVVGVLSAAGGRCLDMACSSSFTALGSVEGLLSTVPFVFGGLGGNVDWHDDEAGLRLAKCCLRLTASSSELLQQLFSSLRGNNSAIFLLCAFRLSFPGFLGCIPILLLLLFN